MYSLAFLWAPFSHADEKAGLLQDSTQIVSRMEAAAARQRANLCAYSVEQRYTLKNKHLNPSAEMDVRMDYKKGQPKHFQVLAMKAQGVAKSSLQKLLHRETDTSGKDGHGKDSVDTANYQFKLLGLENCGNGRCYKLQLKPRHNTKYLVDGTAWVNVDDFGLVRVSGHLSKSPSFWLSQPVIEQHFEKVDEFWLPSYNRSSSHVLFLGEADLTIEYSGYNVKACDGTA